MTHSSASGGLSASIPPTFYALRFSFPFHVLVRQRRTAMAQEEKTLNGLRPEKFQAILDSMRDDPEVRKGGTGPWKSRVVWQRGLKAKAYMRKHAVEMDEPEGLDASDSAASAHEQLLSAVGGCMTVGFVVNATKRGVKIHDLEIALEGNFDNILKWAGHSQTGNPGYPAIKAKVFVRADAEEATLREIWKAAVEGSPVTQTVARPTQIIPEFEMVSARSCF